MDHDHGMHCTRGNVCLYVRGRMIVFEAINRACFHKLDNGAGFTRSVIEYLLIIMVSFGRAHSFFLR